MGWLKVDLHDIYSDGRALEETLEQAMAQAVSKRLEMVEIIPGKGSGQLKKQVLRFLQRPDIKKLYHRIEKDDKNFGRVFVHPPSLFELRSGFAPRLRSGDTEATAVKPWSFTSAINPRIEFC